MRYILSDYYGMDDLKNTMVIYIELKKKTQSEVATNEFLIWEAYVLFISKSTKQQNNQTTIT